MDDPISREDAINAIYHHFPSMTMGECANVLHEVPSAEVTLCHLESPCEYQNADIAMPSAQPERYTKEELRVFQHGISLSLLSKRSAQHWRYDEDTATEIEFLERLYEKVGADMRGEQDE